ncbi:DUF3263 domain-containing protein [Rhodococcus opacus]|uniref:DUF3263 domain-containing protein n=2 Tax=Rhodococcus opacus TaxID=37919 RepID=A0A1B1K128_RHOOP|nr:MULTISPECIES: DUF3263 domain-containing protein [Rhodococcus]ELB92224.1 hypothetical protein Rwratislav_15318 [Rhodococcus wratislaviensis IFP 2016]NHU48988.1 DUF3263 domain-containing protein [Rhodococcus sp. A14]ANS26292.1 hypothetical protein R1CP_07855 [Rhodococcus opacus]EKT77343.1 hypothetical protein WSS_A37901 [Rhodococcus opacus M213]MBA8959187.1 hypothetical protein [Rhodococcus opacus]
MPETDTAELVDFERRWYRLGGGPADDIETEFGLPPATFFRRLEDLLETDPPETLTPSEASAMLRVCRRRLWLDE